MFNLERALMIQGYETKIILSKTYVLFDDFFNKVQRNSEVGIVKKV